MSHLEKCKAYYEARANYDSMKAESDAAEKRMRAVMSELIDSMIDANVKSFSMDDGTTVSMKRNFAIACNQDNEFEVRDWLQTVEGDVHAFEKSVLDKSAITQLLKDKIENAVIEEHDVPAFFNLQTRPVIAVKGWKGRDE